MTDQHICRGKRLDGNGWVTGYLCKRVVEDDDILVVRDAIQQIWEDADGPCSLISYIDPSTVGRCTGLRDKNGKLIFDGDIIERRLLPTKRVRQKSIVKYASEHAAFAIKDTVGGHIVEDYLDSVFRVNYEVEVCGNVTDNPELLGD